MVIAVVVVVYGLPASGKSTLIHNSLQQLLNNNNNNNNNTKNPFSSSLHNIDLLHLEYDALDKQDNTDTFDTEQWKETRIKAITFVERILKGEIMANDDVTKRVHLEKIGSGKQDGLFIIIDDNMFYRSMRKLYYNLARKYNASYAQVYVECSRDTCILRNAARSKPLPTNVIDDVARRFEPPDPLTHAWEGHSTSISSEGDVSNLSFPWEQVIHYCKEPLPPECDFVLEKEQEASREANLKSMAHQFDLKARKQISLFISEFSKSGNPRKLATLGKELSELKNNFITKLHKDNIKQFDKQFLTRLENEFQIELRKYVDK